MDSSYDVDLDDVARRINESCAKRVLLQLPDGLKPRAKEFQDFLRAKCSAEVLVWAGSSFGSCDIPLEASNVGVDVVVHFGHPAWK
jgi:diphthamide biosynthesis enzyme Dph1/Dph2-like protein